MKKEAPLWSGIDSKEKFDFYKIWSFFLFIKFIFIFLTPLSADEAYYWTWSKFLQLGYFDHPAFVSWLWWLGSLFFPNSVAAKIPAVLGLHICLGLFVLSWKKLFPQIQMKLYLLVLMAHPMTGLGGILLTPDLPLFCFWFLSFFLFSLILTQYSRQQDASWKIYAAFGLCLGLGFSSKYMMVLFGLHLILWTALVLYKDRPFLKFLTFKNLFFIVFFGFIGCLPTLIWNFNNHWISFFFQIDHGFGRPDYNWRWTADYFIGSLLLSLPFLLFMPLSLLWSKPEDLSRFQFLSAQKHIVYFSILSALIPFGFFFKSSFYGHVELNWPSMAYPFLIPLALIFSRRQNVMKNYSLFLFVCTLGLYIPLLFYPEKLTGKFFNEFVLLKERSKYALQLKPLWTCDYQSASLFSFYSGENVYKVPGCSRFDFYDTRKEFKPNPEIKKIYFYHHDEQKIPEILKVKSMRELITFDKGWSIKEIDLL